MLENLNETEIVNLIRKMSDDELHASAVRTAERERKITLVLLRHLNEIERRHLFSKFSVSNMHEYCVKELKYADGSAGRRVSAARLLQDIPILKSKILSGSMSLTNLSKAGIFFRQEAKAGNAFSIDEKRVVLESIDNRSTREAERILLTHTDQPEIHFREKITPKSETMTQVTLHLDAETMAALERLKEIWSHANPNASLADTIKRAAKETLARKTPAPRSEKSKIKQAIWDRDQSQCTFEANGERCSSRHFLEEDHIVPKAAGGKYTVENLRLRCRAHNLRHAINFYGLEKMEPHLRH